MGRYGQGLLLAPLLDNNRGRIELLNSLLLSFPGTPILYYGDELGMGDNYHLGDRHGVRTPMQWSPDRNAGFSPANPQSLYLPVIIDPEYNYEVVNAETAERNQSSFLWWMRRLIAAYKTLPALGGGGLGFVHSENTKVLCFLRIHGENRLLVVANLSRYAQVVELDLSEQAGYTPVEVFGRTRFPVIRQELYVLTLGSHDHFWFQLENGPEKPPLAGAKPTVRLAVDAENGINLRENRAALESSLLLAALARSLRGAAPAGTFRELKIVDALPVKSPDPGATLFVVEGVQGQSPLNTHLLFLSVIGEKRLETFTQQAPDAVLATLAGQGGPAILADGFEDLQAVAGLAALLGAKRKFHGLTSRFLVENCAPKSLLKDLAHPSGQVRRIQVTPYTVCYSLGDAVFLKIFRRPEEGSHPEPELLSILNAAGFQGVPRLLSSLAYQRPRGDTMMLAVAMEYVQDAADGATFVLDGVDRYLQEVLASGIAAPAPLPADPFAQPETTPAQLELLGGYTLEFFRLLGRRTSQFHRILAGLDTPAFAPEPVTKFYLRSQYQTMRNLTQRTAQAVERMARSRGPVDGQPFRSLPVSLLLQHFSKLLTMEPMGLRIRTHGDFQLENVLHLGKDFMLVDFDGDVRIPLGERSFKRPALRDVASMIFSIGFTSEKALRRHLERNPTHRDELAPWLSLWRRTAILAYLSAYLQDAGSQTFLPQQDEVTRQLLMVFILEHSLRSMNRSLEEAPDDVFPMMEMTDFLLNLFP